MRNERGSILAAALALAACLTILMVGATGYLRSVDRELHVRDTHVQARAAAIGGIETFLAAVESGATPSENSRDVRDGTLKVVRKGERITSTCRKRGVEVTIEIHFSLNGSGRAAITRWMEK